VVLILRATYLAIKYEKKANERLESQRSPWNESFQEKITGVMQDLPPEELLDFGCALQHGSFECKPRPRGLAVHFSTQEEALIFFIIRLMVRLRALGTAPAADMMQYGRALESLSSFRDAT
jgi:hypothetical protein